MRVRPSWPLPCRVGSRGDGSRSPVRPLCRCRLLFRAGNAAVPSFRVCVVVWLWLCVRDGANRCCNAQVEQQRQPWLKGLPVVVRQHSDIIAVSYEARALGVKKHMLPRDVRTKFPTVRIVHTYTINSKCVRMGSTRIPASSDMSVWRVFVHQGVVPILP